MDNASGNNAYPDNLNPLPVGAHLQEFVVEKLVGIGGFGIVYQANDTLLGRSVAIKEYMPTSMASRRDGATVSVRSEAYTQDFESGKRSFINEARMLARFKHAALIEVFRFWEQNGTAYMATPFYEGKTLKEKLQSKQPEKVDQAYLLKILHPIFDALEVMHAEQVFHRDISPDNIMVLPDGRPVLLDLGAARKVLQEGSQALTVMVKPGYAPIEQYADDATVKQGPWTDIYALGAVINHAITGKAPPPAASRLLKDSRANLRDSEIIGFTHEFLAATDAALRVRPEDRPQSISEFRKLLVGELSLPATSTGNEIVAKNVLADTELTSQEIADSDRTIVVPRTITKSMLASESNNAVEIGVKSQEVERPKKIASFKVAAVMVVLASLLGIYWFVAMPEKKEAPLPTAAPASAPVPTPEVIKPAEVPKAAPVSPPTIADNPLPATVPEATPDSVKAIEKPSLVRFNIKPWGEVFVDGESKGVSPPLKSLSLPAGQYSVEVRNGEFVTFTTKLVIKSGEPVNLSHVFNESLPNK
jgi:serine/threonine protein kinase